MFFSVQNSSGLSLQEIKNKITLLARLRIMLFPMRTTEQQLEEFLIDDYKMPLKFICLSLLAKIKITTDQKKSDTINITFIDKQSDKLASLITYGNGVNINGSKILRIAFEQQY